MPRVFRTKFAEIRNQAAGGEGRSSLGSEAVAVEQAHERGLGGFSGSVHAAVDLNEVS